VKRSVFVKFLCRCVYTDEVFPAIAKALDTKIYCDFSQKLRSFGCQSDPELHGMLTRGPRFSAQRPPRFRLGCRYVRTG